MQRTFLSWGFFFGMSAVILGAFAAHALEKVLSPDQLDSFQTGVRYQMYHALLLIFLGMFEKLSSKLLLYLIVIGVFLFSFSIYLLNLKDLLSMDFLRFLGPITPIGGSFLIIAWASLFLKAIKSKFEA